MNYYLNVLWNLAQERVNSTILSKTFPLYIESSQRKSRKTGCCKTKYWDSVSPGDGTHIRDEILGR